MKRCQKRRGSPLSNCKGSSLMEVIVSFVVVLVAAGIFYGGYRISLTYFRSAEELHEKTEALLAAYYAEDDEGEVLNGEFTVSVPEGTHDGSIMSTGSCEIGASRRFTVHCIERNGIKLYFFRASDKP